MTGLLRHHDVPAAVASLKPRYDVVIVGGGVNGLSLAYNLAGNHGIRDVAVFERTYIGSGGIGRNTQVVRANYNTTETVPLYKASLGIWRTLCAELDFNILFSTQGELDLVPHDRHAARWSATRPAEPAPYGVDTEILTPDEVARACARWWT